MVSLPKWFCSCKESDGNEVRIVCHALKGYNVPLLPDAGALLLIVSRLMARLREWHSGQEAASYCRIKFGPGISAWPTGIAGHVAASSCCLFVRRGRVKREQGQRKKS
jgi:hypothetical protein